MSANFWQHLLLYASFTMSVCVTQDAVTAIVQQNIQVKKRRQSQRGPLLVVASAIIMEQSNLNSRTLLRQSLQRCEIVQTTSWTSTVVSKIAAEIRVIVDWYIHHHTARRCDLSLDNHKRRILPNVMDKSSVKCFPISFHQTPKHSKFLFVFYPKW